MCLFCFLFYFFFGLFLCRDAAPWNESIDASTNYYKTLSYTSCARARALCMCFFWRLSPRSFLIFFSLPSSVVLIVVVVIHLFLIASRLLYISYFFFAIFLHLDGTPSSENNSHGEWIRRKLPHEIKQKS